MIHSAAMVETSMFIHVRASHTATAALAEDAVMSFYRLAGLHAGTGPPDFSSQLWRLERSHRERSSKGGCSSQEGIYSALFACCLWRVKSTMMKMSISLGASAHCVVTA
jgi:hypothetical protein